MRDLENKGAYRSVKIQMTSVHQKCYELIKKNSKRVKCESDRERRRRRE
jgi:hypothetical protein